MKTRIGKIAQLPKSIRDDLNHRFENGKQGRELLEWLNSLPETKELIAQKFDNQPVTASNLSDWRHGGFQDWRADQIREARIQRICETGSSLEQAETGDLFENFARITVAEMMVDLDAVQKLRGEKRSQHLHHLVRDLARLQNSYNRSRWADLAWTKYNDNNSGTGVSPVRTAELETPNSQPETVTATPSPTTPLVPDRAQSHGGDLDDPEPKPDGNGMYVLHFTDCNCYDPCPKCHAPDSEYPLDEAIRDHNFKMHSGRYPCDRHGKSKFLINVACDCYCDRCANVASALRADSAGRVALPRDPIIRHERPASDDSPKTSIVRETQTPSAQVADFPRRMALLKTASLLP